MNLIVSEILETELVSLRRTIHTNPELGYQEYATSNLISEKLTSLNIPFESNIANTKTGIIGTLSKGSGPTIVLRADMDALPLQEETNLSFASKNPNIMHACGHDIHTTMLIGAANLLKKADFDGTIKFVFQPSEEGNKYDPVAKIGELKESGGKRIAESGQLNNIKAALALHVHPLLPVGKIAFSLGNALAAAAFFDVEIIGVESHAAFPDQSIDPIFISSHFIMAAQGIVSRYTPPNESKVVSFTNVIVGKKNTSQAQNNIHSAENIIPRIVTLSGTIRALNFEIYQKIKQNLEDVANGLKIAFKATDIIITYTLDYPSLINDKSVHLKLNPVLTKLFGHDNTVEIPALLAGEDFAFYARKMPSMFYFLGANFQNRNEFLHNANVIFDESCIKYGTEFLANSALQLLQE